MKKLLVLTALILFSGISNSQTLEKGNLIGFHVLTINLNPNVTMDQFQDVFFNKLIPDFEKHFPGLKNYSAKGIRGENVNGYAWIVLFESEEIRNKYFNEDGSFTELGNSANEKLQPAFEELNTMGTFTRSYTDWIVQ